MRCPTCGTDNEADSRFCGGCGARIGQQPQPRLAPTHKIHDDAPYPQQSAQPAVMPSGPVSYAPPSIPPASAQRSAQPQPPPASIATPAPGSLVRPASQPAAAQMSSASASFAVPPRRPLGLMVALLIVDLGLAAAGAVLLSKGLADDEPASDAKAEPAAVDKKSEAPVESATPAHAAASRAPAPVAAAPVASAPAASARAAAPAVGARPAAAAPAPSAPAARKDTTKQRDDKKLAAATAAVPVASGPVTSPTATAPAPDKASDKASSEATLVTAVPSEPQDPYPVADTEREIDAAAARSKSALDRCAADHGPVQGKIEIAFQVRPDGRVANAAAVENSTGNSELARCLVAEISSWRVSAHQGAALNLSRPFTYR